MGSMFPNIRLIHYVAVHILIPRKYKIGYLSKDDVVIIWLLNNKVEINWASAVINHMIGSKRKRIIWLPYGNLITNILGNFVFTVEDEVSLEKSIRIRNDVLW